MALGDADIASGVFFADFGVPVVFGGVTALGNFDAPGKDSIFERSSVSNVEYTLLIGMAAFSPQPKPKDTLTVSGVSYAVQSSTPLDDGAVIEFKLRKL